MASSLRSSKEDLCGRFAFDSARFKMRCVFDLSIFLSQVQVQVQFGPSVSKLSYFGTTTTWLRQLRQLRQLRRGFDSARFKMINGRGRDLSSDFLLFDRENGVPGASLSPKRRYLQKSVICGIPDITALR